MLPFSRSCLLSLSISLGFLWCVAECPAEQETSEEFVSLFNGENLDGWVNVNCAPETFSVRDGMIVSTGKPTGVMRTEQQYENFILELEWKHIEPMGNAGLFIWSDAITARGVPFTRSIEVQILDGRNSDTYTSHGDVFAIHGATFVPDRPHPNGAMRCLPSEHRCRPAGEWNHYRVVCRDGDIELAVNGKVVSGGNESVPRKGYICLESEGTECHFRNIRICELPAGNATEDQTARSDEGFETLYSGLDLRGWKTSSKGWEAKDWMLSWNSGNATGLDDIDSNMNFLISENKFLRGTLICDFRLSDPENKDSANLSFNGIDVRFESAEIAAWNRLQITCDETVEVRLNDEVIMNQPLPEGATEASPIVIRPGSAPFQIANLYFRPAAE